jgi:hypothetical protein
VPSVIRMVKAMTSDARCHPTATSASTTTTPRKWALLAIDGTPAVHMRCQRSNQSNTVATDEASVACSAAVLAHAPPLHSLRSPTGWFHSSYRHGMGFRTSHGSHGRPPQRGAGRSGAKAGPLAIESCRRGPRCVQRPKERRSGLPKLWPKLQAKAKAHIYSHSPSPISILFICVWRVRLLQSPRPCCELRARRASRSTTLNSLLFYHRETGSSPQQWL